MRLFYLEYQSKWALASLQQRANMHGAKKCLCALRSASPLASRPASGRGACAHALSSKSLFGSWDPQLNFKNIYISFMGPLINLAALEVAED